MRWVGVSTVVIGFIEQIYFKHTRCSSSVFLDEFSQISCCLTYFCFNNIIWNKIVLTFCYEIIFLKNVAISTILSLIGIKTPPHSVGSVNPVVLSSHGYEVITKDLFNGMDVAWMWLESWPLEMKWLYIFDAGLLKVPNLSLSIFCKCSLPLTISDRFVFPMHIASEKKTAKTNFQVALAPLLYVLLREKKDGCIIIRENTQKR